jgi:hypothetical protein
MQAMPAGRAPARRVATATPARRAARRRTARRPATRFDFHWVPTHTTKTISGGCKQAIDVHRDLRERVER